MEKFLWGVSTSAAQVEGASNKDGKGETLWDYYSKNKAIIGGDTCFDSCDCYNRTKEDIKIMNDLGVNSYRFSLCWSRMFPEDSKKINQKGVDYYSKFIDDLLNAGIEPFVTLYHWDMPIYLFEKGGFSNRDIIHYIEDYAELVGKTLGDRVKYFSVFNEPECIVDFSYLHPIWDNVEKRRSYQETYEAMHNLMLANGLGSRVLKSVCKNDIKLGIASATDVCVPNSSKDVEAAREAMFAPRPDLLFDNATFLDAAFFGKHYQPTLEKFNIDTSFVKDGDMELIKYPLDYIGCNIYTGRYVEFDEDNKVVDSKLSPNRVYANGRMVVPESVYYGPKFIHERYNVPIYITENGFNLSEMLNSDGKLLDDTRCECIKSYISEVMRAKRDGVDLRGYFYWSLFDNFEWKFGYVPKFGIVHVDFENFKRTPKQSYYTYKDCIKKYRGEDK